MNAIPQEDVDRIQRYIEKQIAVHTRTIERCSVFDAEYNEARGARLALARVRGRLASASDDEGRLAEIDARVKQGHNGRNLCP